MGCKPYVRMKVPRSYDYEQLWAARGVSVSG